MYSIFRTHLPSQHRKRPMRRPGVKDCRNILLGDQKSDISLAFLFLPLPRGNRLPPTTMSSQNFSTAENKKRKRGSRDDLRYYCQDPSSIVVPSTPKEKHGDKLKAPSPNFPLPKQRNDDLLSFGFMGFVVGFSQLLARAESRLTGRESDSFMAGINLGVNGKTSLEDSFRKNLEIKSEERH